MTAEPSGVGDGDRHDGFVTVERVMTWAFLRGPVEGEISLPL
ncbi:hypothetical protein APR03_003091 [Promicromonospora thailandica]|uniref:Uncharacterized protein n=1 Tax=Promicromonospora thailandica TaxID=765201 RepID=A0A9X2G4U9_9MICO|nr:hypothetical protein [Promicromonospora thailandica]